MFVHYINNLWKSFQPYAEYLKIEEYRPFGTLSNVETLGYTGNISPWPGPWSNFLSKARENGLVTPSSLSPLYLLLYFLSLLCKLKIKVPT